MQPPQTHAQWLGHIQAADLALLTKLNKLDHPVLGRVMSALTVLGNTSSWVIAGFGLLMMGGTFTLLGQRLAIAALSGAAIAQVLKRIAKRTRPSHAHSVIQARCDVPKCSSFPSGHTLTAFSVAMALGGLDNGVGTVVLLFACGVGASRVYLGAHYPADVTVGACLGSAWGALFFAFGGPIPS